MAFLDTVTPAEMVVGRGLSAVTMTVLLAVGYVPILRPYATRIRQVTAAAYVLGVAAFALYFVLGR